MPCSLASWMPSASMSFHTMEPMATDCGSGANGRPMARSRGPAQISLFGPGGRGIGTSWMLTVPFGAPATSTMMSAPLM
jgi:hypothetical protein